MEEKINNILENTINVYNQMKVLNDSLMLFFKMIRIIIANMLALK